MSTRHPKHVGIRLTALVLALLLCLSGCFAGNGTDVRSAQAPEADASDSLRYLRIVNDEPDTADPQCTDGCYDIPLNVFDRLVEVQQKEDGSSSFVPSLAQSWEISDDGLVYTFHLQEGVRFSNGSPLTASDVEYTLKRLLTHPDSMAGDVGAFILDADALTAGETDTLEGFRAISDLVFSITLSTPYAAFLAILSTPAASILDEETTAAAGARFGTEPAVTVGTGPFVFQEWKKSDSILLSANRSCWSGAPGSDGILMQFVVDPEAKRLLFENGALDVLDLETLGSDAEYFLRGDIYQSQLVHGRRVGLSYIALNESIEPLNDVRVRHALQLALDRNAILMNIYSGRGELENGIYPHGLIGFNPELPEIPYDPEQAAALLKEAGYPDGFDLELVVDDEGTYYSRQILELAAFMWGKIGVRASIRTVGTEEYLSLRKSGALACNVSRFSVDYNDPDAIILNYSQPLNHAPKSEMAVDGTNQRWKVEKFSTKRAHYPHGHPDGSCDCQGTRPLRYSSRGCRCLMLLSVS